MPLEYSTLDALRTRHPAWRLLRSDHAPLAVSFLHRVFVALNVRVMAAPLLAEALEDESTRCASSSAMACSRSPRSNI